MASQLNLIVGQLIHTVHVRMHCVPNQQPREKRCTHVQIVLFRCNWGRPFPVIKFMDVCVCSGGGGGGGGGGV